MTLNLSKTEHHWDHHDNKAAPWVGDAQARLIARGYSLGPAGADGNFGSRTDAAVRAFQRKLGLAVDGVVGPKTWSHLSAVAPRPTAHTSASAFADKGLARLTGSDGHPRPRYIFGHEVVLTDPAPSAFDCSEAVQWLVYQITKHDWRDGSWNQAEGCHLISVTEAIHTKGALLFISNNGRASGVHHVAISLGNGYTAEACSTSAGCGSWTATGRFNLAGLIPVLKY